jgi:hypothetical protein
MSRPQNEGAKAREQLGELSMGRHIGVARKEHIRASRSPDGVSVRVHLQEVLATASRQPLNSLSLCGRILGLLG